MLAASQEICKAWSWRPPPCKQSAPASWDCLCGPMACACFLRLSVFGYLFNKSNESPSSPWRGCGAAGPRFPHSRLDPRSPSTEHLVGSALGNHYTGASITPMAQGSLQTKLGSWQRQDSNLGLPGHKGHYPQQHSGPCLQHQFCCVIQRTVSQVCRN